MFPDGLTAADILSRQSREAAAMQVAADATAAALNAKVAAKAAADAAVAAVTSSTSRYQSAATVAAGTVNAQVAGTTISPYITSSSTNLSSSLGNSSIMDTNFQPTGILETFRPRRRRVHTMRLMATDEEGDEKDRGGWGLCGRMSSHQFLVFVLGAALAFYMLRMSRERGGR